MPPDQWNRLKFLSLSTALVLRGGEWTDLEFSRFKFVDSPDKNEREDKVIFLGLATNKNHQGTSAADGKVG